MDPITPPCPVAAALPHPIETLAAEHRTILAALAEMEHECASVERDGVVRDAYWRRTLRFLDAFDEHLHHDKEEGLLFPALEAAGLSPHTGPTAVLRSEHGRCRLWRLGIVEALERGSALQLLAAVQGFVDLQRQHIAKEDQILFPLAKQLLSPATFAALARSFDERDDGVDLDLRGAAAARLLRGPGHG